MKASGGRGAGRTDTSARGRGTGRWAGGRGGRRSSNRNGADAASSGAKSETASTAEATRRKAQEDTPNSIAAKAGLPGYDCDGVKLVVQRSDGSYMLQEVWKTYEQWLAENGCSMILPMFTGPDESYPRYAVDEVEDTVDKARYEIETFYRDVIKSKISECRTQHPHLLAQETKGYAKLWSLCDEKILTIMRLDSDFTGWTVESKRPYRLRRLIVRAANKGAGQVGASSKERLRDEWSSWTMEYTRQTLYAYYLSWIDFMERSEAADLKYDDKEQAAKFVSGLSHLWSEKKVLLTELSGTAQMSTVQKAYDDLILWEASQIQVFGRIGANSSNRGVGTYASYAYELEDDVKDSESEKKPHWKTKAGAKKNPKNKNGSQVESKGNEMKTTGEGGTKLAKPDLQCYRCRGYGHIANECGSAMVSMLQVCRMEHKKDLLRYVLMDEGAEASLFAQRGLLSDLKSIQTERLNSFQEGAKALTVNEAGNFYGVPVFVTDGTRANILARCDAASKFDLFNLPMFGTRAIHKITGEVLDFVLEGGATPRLDTSCPIKIEAGAFAAAWRQEMERQLEKLDSHADGASINVLTVDDRAKMFTRQERERAEVAWRFVQNSGYRGKNKIVQSMAKMTNVEITNLDLVNARYIFGPQRGSMKGRTLESTAPLVNPDIRPLMLRRDVKIQCDIMEILEQKFIVGVVRPNSLAMALVLKGSITAGVLRAGLEALCNTCGSMRMRVVEIVIDPEKALVRAGRELGGIPITEVGVGDHVVDAENLILLIKNIARCVIHGNTHWMFPPSLVPPLVYYAVRRRNAFITDATGEIPLEAISGQKINWKWEYKVGLGDMVEVYSKPKKKSQMIERTLSAVALYPIGYVGAWRVKFLDTWTEGTARKFELMHTDAETVTRMNKLCEAEKPSVVYRNALKLEMDSKLEGADWAEEPEDGPALVEARPFLPFIEEEVEADQPLDDNHDHMDDIAHAEGDATEGVATDIDNTEAVQADTGEMVFGNGNAQQYQICIIAKEGPPKAKFFMATMRKGSTRSTLNKALRQRGGRGDRAMEAAIAELKQIDDKGSWTPVLKQNLSREERKGIVRTFMFVIDKFTPSGELLKVKARLVAMGNMQDPAGITMDTSAPTVDITSVLVMAAITAAEGRYKMTCDVGGAFLHTVWPKEKGRQIVHLDRINARLLIQIRPEYEKFLQADGCMLMELERALYGLVQSARLWYDRLTGVLAQDGYKANAMDPCVWNKGELANQCTVLFHVDDLSCSCKVLESIRELENMLIGEFGEEHIKCVYGDEQDYLGMRFTYNKHGRVDVDMEGYLQAVLDFAGLTGTETAKTPANANLFLIKEDAKKLDFEKGKKFHSLVQGLSYASQRVRWDLLLAISFLKGRVSCADDFDWQKLMRVLAYVNSTKGVGLTLGVAGDTVKIDASIDASHAVYQNGRSQGGLAMSLGIGAIKARSHKLGLTTKSSAESETVTTSDNASEVIWLREFLVHQGYNMGAAVVRQDNQAAMTLLNKGRSDSKRTKHINTRFFFVHDRIVNGEIILEWTPTDEMVADFFTKPLQGELFLKMRDKLLGVSVFAPLTLK